VRAIIRAICYFVDEVMRYKGYCSVNVCVTLISKKYFLAFSWSVLDGWVREWREVVCKAIKSDSIVR
jgi:hypothetical protein